VVLVGLAFIVIFALKDTREGYLQQANAKAQPRLEAEAERTL
jgi:hypothetical protein